eukprot:TRINITY_DN221_c1_g1_i3.p1 TRINITY_DN221_c1_g1~~TRINITY_DN221_c1_g1_i3.p1  ORF type:complete len:228 (+),score=65.80 TRINITY_DN221_c1_g1_i3:310-993(+)
MRRLFGGKKKAYEGPSLGQVSKNMGDRADTLDEKIRKLDGELIKYKEQMKKQRGPALNATKQRALRVLKQKKMYEKQRDNTYNQQFNIDQAAFTHETLKDTKETVEAMKHANKEMKQAYKQFDIEDIEDLHDDMSELMEDANEIQDVLGRNYDINDEFIDEDELDAELAALEDEMQDEELGGMDSAPAYLDTTPSVPTTLPGGQQAHGVDEFGLPTSDPDPAQVQAN